MQTRTRRKGKVATGILSLFVACALMVPASSANAQSTANLQVQINQLLAMIASLQAQLSGESISASCDTTWTRNLGIGSTGTDVRALQRFLNLDPETRLALSGAGSPGMETQYYGPITAAAVSKFQTRYRAEILTPLGLINPTGYFGDSSRAKANELCATQQPPQDDDDATDDDDELRGGEASLERFDVSDVDTSLAEGDDEVEVMEGEFNVEDGDVRINRMDVAFDHLSGGDDDPWDVFESIALIVDGDVIAEMDIDDEDEWSDDTPNNGDYQLRLSNLDEWIVREGDTAEFTIAVTVAGSVDDADTGVTWEMFIPDNGIRATDSENINHYIGDTDDTVQFDIDEEGNEDELIVRTSNEDPKATTLQLESNMRSDWFTVFAFDLDTDDSQNDIEVDSLPITVNLSTSTYDTLVNDVRVEVDGEQYDDYTITNGASSTATVTFNFDNDELVIDAGDRAAVEFQVRFNALASVLQGTTIESDVDGDNIEAEGADDLEAGQLGGSATSETHTLRTEGLNISFDSETASVRTTDTGTNESGNYTIRFEVTAFESDIYIPRTAASGTTLGTAGVNFLVENGTGSTVGSGSVNSALTSNASVSGSNYRISEGQTRTFTLSVSYDPTVTDFYRVQLYSVNFNDSNTTPDVQQRALPESDYETDVVRIRA